MTPVEPAYGETPVDPDDLAALTPDALTALDPDLTKAALYDLEQQILIGVSEDLMGFAADGSLTVAELLTDGFLRDLHRQLYGDVWRWAGRFRTREVTIGVAPERVAVELRESLESLHYRWTHTPDFTPRHLGIAVHADAVRIHPFVDGNGRSTRLLADLVFIAAQDDAPLLGFDWNVDKPQYIAILRRYDQTRDASELADFIPTVAIT